MLDSRRASNAPRLRQTAAAAAVATRWKAFATFRAIRCAHFNRITICQPHTRISDCFFWHFCPVLPVDVVVIVVVCPMSIDCRRSAAPGTNDTEWKMPARHVPIRVSRSIFFFQLVFRWCLRRKVLQEEKRENERVSSSIAKWHNFFSSLSLLFSGFLASAFRVNLPVRGLLRCVSNRK